jgi:hypothetical protein
MKTGLRKLCDVEDCATYEQITRSIEKQLKAMGIKWERHFHYSRTREFHRYAVQARDLPRALEALPLTLRGFKEVLTPQGCVMKQGAGL